MGGSLFYKWYDKGMKTKVIIIVIGLVIIGLGIVIYARYAAPGDTYYDKNGCAQSRSGGIHSTLCIKR